MTIARGYKRTLKGIYEVTYGTTPSVSPGGMALLPFIDCSLKGSTQKINPDSIIGHRFDVPPDLGNETVGGSLSVPADMRNIGYWLKLLMGSPTTTNNLDGTYSHKFEPSTSDLPSMTLEYGQPDITHFRRFTGCKVNSMGLRFAKGENLTASMELIGKSESSAASTLDATPTSKLENRFLQRSVIVSSSGTPLGVVRSCDVQLANNMIEDLFVLDGTAFRSAAPEGNFSIRGNMVVVMEGSTWYDLVKAGTEYNLKMETIIDNGSNTDFRLTLEQFEIQFDDVDTDFGGRGLVTQTLPIFGYYQNAGAGTAARITLVNDVASYA